MEYPKGRKKKSNTGLRLDTVTPLTKNQTAFFDIYDDYQVISLIGSAGTGKTFLALYKALEEIEYDDSYTDVTIIRSAVSSRNIGFLPGTKEEKMEAYEGPYMTSLSKLYNRGDAYGILKQKGQINFIPSSFLRGETFDNKIIIVDEAQNLSYTELYTIITRIGQNCKMIICGDYKQDDLTSERYKEESGLGPILDILDRVPSAAKVCFGIKDIVRSGFLREFLIAAENEKVLMVG